VQVILGYNSILLNNLQNRMKMFHFGTCLGEAFLKLTDFLKVYTSYCNNYPKALTKTTSLRQSIPEFKSFIEKARSDPRCNDLEFTQFLILPIQRIPRYVLLLSDMVRYTPRRHEDYSKLNLALEKMRTVAEYVNEGKRLVENLQEVAKVQEKLHGKLPENYAANLC